VARRRCVAADAGRQWFRGRHGDEVVDGPFLRRPDRSDETAGSRPFTAESVLVGSSTSTALDLDELVSAASANVWPSALSPLTARSEVPVC
jgi:hypothetical protein